MYIISGIANKDNRYIKTVSKTLFLACKAHKLSLETEVPWILLLQLPRTNFFLYEHNEKISL